MKVTKDNYESLLIDYLDGTLDATLVTELLSFIHAHDHLKAELEMLQSRQQDHKVEPTADVADFSFLKKPEQVEITGELTNLMIAHLEGDLGTAAKNDLKRKLELYPQLTAEMSLLQRTIMQPDTDVVFAHKEQLKRKAPARIIPLFVRIASVAAVLFFVVSAVAIYYSLQEPAKQGQVAEAVPGDKKMQVEPSAAVHEEKENSHAQVAQPKDESSENEHSVSVKNTLSGIQQILSKEVHSLAAVVTTSIDPTPVKLPVITTPPQVNTAAVEQPAAPATADFLTPKDWLLQKFRSKVAVGRSLPDTLTLAGAKIAAAQLLNKSTGISYTEKKDQNGSNTGFTLVTKFFAIERSAGSNY